MRSNCLIWCIQKKLCCGGQIKWTRSRTWSGFHTSWIDDDGDEWEYTVKDIRIMPWWYVPLLYNGIVRKVAHGRFNHKTKK
jgi:hypothetical protein